ncbi:MAG: divalent-cation tolerance protein CutA [Deltaproteobacteria bacterium]|nr:divalent-cation tolerance protein CutA [Deltaproteobacteria bacterium]
MKANLIYITAGSMDEARGIAKALVSNRLAACANIIDNMNSLYWWNGEIQEEREVILIAKTVESLVPEVIDKVKSMHSYECPCIVSLPIIEGNPAFLEWIEKETR